MKSFAKLGLAVCLFSLAVIHSHSADAGSIFSIAIQDVSLPPDGSGEVSVSISGAGESINLAGYEFQISPVGGATSQLQFLEESEAFLSDASYLFVGNSFAASDGTSSSVGTVSTNVLPNDTFVGGDSTNDLSDVAISGSKLMVKLAVQHSTGPADPATTAGHEFAISLVPMSGDSSAFAGGSSNTGFVDNAFNGIGFASQSGTVTIAVPEPATLLLLIVAAASVVARRRG